MRHSKVMIAIFTAALVTASCGGDDSESEASDGSAPEASAAPAATEGTEPSAGTAEDTTQDDAGSDTNEASPSAGGSGSATLELANGETFEFSILCGLESQEVAGSEIVFNAVSYDDPGLDVTQFGDEGTVTDFASISVYTSDFETLWDANTIYEAFGGSIELSLEGSTITGSGSFYADADPTTEPVDGQLRADC
jgi:hypothetical protein